MSKKINHKMIPLARESRGINQLELSKLLEIPQSNLSRIERGELGVKKEVLKEMSAVLKYPESFFFQRTEIYPPNTHYRKRASLDHKTLAKADALMNIYRFNIQEMLNSLELSAKNIPILDEYDNPSKVAAFLRSYWKVPKGSIDNLCKLLEDNGIIIIRIDFETDKIDGRSVITDTGNPIIFVNSKLSGDRQRITIGHELGHIILHINTFPGVGRDEESEAFEFASEFLMPDSEVRHYLKRKITFSLLAELKQIWKISMQSIVVTAAHRGYVSPNQYRYLMSQFNARGIKKKEPIYIPPEFPTLVKRMINLFEDELKYSSQEIANIFCLTLKEFEDTYIPTETPRLRIA